MIVISHHDNKVKTIFKLSTKEKLPVKSNCLVTTLFDLSHQFNNTLLIWCDASYVKLINEKDLNTIFHHKLIMSSYNPRETNYINDRVGYIEASPFIKINKQVKYPTWLMSSFIGGVNTDVIACYNYDSYLSKSFEYTLNSIAKVGMTNGLFCYSNPQLLCNHNLQLNKVKPSNYNLFRFIKNHYKTRWLFLLLLNILIYERRFFLFPFLVSLFSSKKISEPSFSNLNLESKSISSEDRSIDVIIPTLRRKSYLYDVLKDLSVQTLLPKNVIIIEQNPEEDSFSELDYLSNEKWPFQIAHSFTHVLGACNARNIALNSVKSSWVFMADDDIRFNNNTLEIALKEMNKYSLNAATLKCLRQNDISNETLTYQWSTFGSGCSIISQHITKIIRFDKAYEHGFGEDGDFGMQIREMGEDVGYISKCSLLHLKAPVGGFRNEFGHFWTKDKIQPKPSPTIMLYNLKHQTSFQLNGYKTKLFIMFFNRQKNKNILSYIRKMNIRWNKSIDLAIKLKNETNKK